MAGISTGTEQGKKSVDHEIPLIPFIDLLLCCIMFLLVTAVWNRLASVDAHLDQPGAGGIDEVTTQTLPLVVRVRDDGYLITSDAGEEVRIPRDEGGELDREALGAHLAARQQIAPDDDHVVVSADDPILYAQLVDTMDVLMSHGFHDVSLGQ